ncbi:MAG: DUF2914 domain-containing protein [Candidatus Aminicenantes bacterium]|nr:DUF2914 domain-containing protein [Candidatus Aminicenantes bacterium]MBL7083049.1 DUF2914 domain-containing protein [Candidatus Aminicenantes bacterium]
MKKIISALFVLVLLMTFSLYNAVAIKAQEAATIEVEVGIICLDVVDREPVDPGDTFNAAVGNLFCYTKIVGAQESIEITHVWYFGETERARINLTVESASWRTWTTKIIQAHELGDWHVDVIGPDGEILETIKFQITS